MRLGKIIMVFILGCIVSAYYFPFAFTFFPDSLNTKQIMAVIGILCFMFHGRARGTWNMSRQVVVSALFAIVFSVWCYACITLNNTNDTSYASYIVSFSVWLGGAYGVYSILKFHHGKVDLALLTKYLAAVCLAQCIIALMIDNIPAVKTVVDTYIDQGQEYFEEVKRLYGIGAALDPAGVRFTVVLVLLAHQIAKNADVNENSRLLTMNIVLFLGISVIGNMISRTTSVGMVMGLAYIGWNTFRARRSQMTKAQLRIITVFATLIGLTVVLLVFLYNTNAEVRSLLRFAFEGFFNWVETGEFSTGSTDKLNSIMWIWPKTTDAWIYGTGLFDNFVYSTDIGYCRFTLYCGLVGLSIFSLFFVYNSLSVRFKFKDSGLLCLMIMSLTFIVWLKVATDIFFINALLFCIDSDDDTEDLQLAQDE